tara:strand:+ start:1890 stop:2105 length:216 start_codon:yes stop_codon:yes gene_type:complete
LRVLGYFLHGGKIVLHGGKIVLHGGKIVLQGVNYFLHNKIILFFLGVRGLLSFLVFFNIKNCLISKIIGYF